MTPKQAFRAAYAYLRGDVRVPQTREIAHMRPWAMIAMSARWDLDEMRKVELRIKAARFRVWIRQIERGTQ